MRRAGSASLLLCLAVAALLGACDGGGDDDDDNAATSPTQSPTTEATTTPSENREDEEGGGDEAESQPEDGEGDEAPRLSADERAVTRTVRDYVGALDDRDGEALCALLVPGAIDEVELPKGGGCVASLEASIGYRDPRGLPVWEAARVAELRTVEVSSDSAKVVVTTVTQFADRNEPSIEDDVVYLVRSGGGWRIAKPSSTLYRAVGIADVPPSVLAAP